MLLRDIRYAVRRLWQSKGFATVAILCLGFGIGVNTTIFSIIDGVLLQPYPYTDPDRLLVLGEQNVRTKSESGLSFLDLRDWKEATSAFTTIAASQGRVFTVSDESGEPERVAGAGISWDLFPMLGMSPMLGRGFTSVDDQAHAGDVVLLSHTLWMRRYHSDRSVLGRTVLVNATPYTIVGVMPPRFEFPENQRLWVPLTPMTLKDGRAVRNLFAFGRLKPDVTRKQALDDLNAICARLAKDYPPTNDGWTASTRTLREDFLPADVKLVLYLMMAGVTLVLFIACSNVANLLLSRAADRRREFAVRAAIGAGRGTIVRQLLTESVVLGLASVPLGLGLAEIGTKLIAAAIPADEVPYYIQWQVDWRTLAYAIAVAATTALLFGLFPALQVSRTDLHEGLKEGTRGNSAGRSLLRSSLVVAQVSLALVALVGALLFVRTFVNLNTYDVGFDTRPLMTMRYYMTGAAYEPPGAKARRVEDIVRRVERLAGVQAAFSSVLVPISGGGEGGDIEVEGRAIERGERSQITFAGVTPHFNQTLGVGVLHGRDFTDSEGWSRTPVALVNQTMAKRFWPDKDPVERRFRVSRSEGFTDWFTIIGVLPDFHVFGIERGNRPPLACAFIPYGYSEAFNTGLTIRVHGDPASITSAVRAEIRGSDSNIPLYWVRPLEDVRRVSFWQYGVYGWIFGTIGIVGLLLASVGVYGVLSYSVSQRTQEIGVRLALGAGRRDVLRLIVGQGVLLAGIGVVVGLALALAGTPLTKTFLYKVSPFDPFTFTIVSAFLLAVATLASYVPALRATKVDPVIALRGE